VRSVPPRTTGFVMAPDRVCQQSGRSEADSGPLPDGGRRGWLAAAGSAAFALGLLALGTAGGLWSAAVARFFWPNVRREPPRRFRVGGPGDYPPGYVETRFKDEHGVWVVHGTYEGQEQIYALSAACTHLGCITLWLSEEARFKCPCHGSGFRADGINVEGPAPRPLERFAIRLLNDGQLEVDTSQTFREELGQWRDPACYVLV